MELLHKLLSTPYDFMRDYGLPFLLVLGVLVFIHEFGHYIIARWAGVKIISFSIGFGPELFGITDKRGTRWKVSLIPLGGYVQMFGDIDPASVKHDDKVEDHGKSRALTPEEKKVAFYSQPIGKRAAIVFAGPAINYIFAIVVLSLLYAIQGEPYLPPVAAAIISGSPAEKAGFTLGDKVLTINGEPVRKFQDLKKITMLNLDKELDMEVVHSTPTTGVWETKTHLLKVKPEIVNETDRFGFAHQTGRIGIGSPEGAFEIETHTPVEAVGAAVYQVYSITADTLHAIGQMIIGVRSPDELGGILRIGAYAGEFAKEGLIAFITFGALLSVNLGLVNLLPVPMLDGGHLAMYAMEKLRGKPLNERHQEYAFRVGLTFLLGIMIFATWNDLVQLKIVAYLVKHV